MTDLTKLVINELKGFKSVFLNSTDWSRERELGIFEVTDHLDGISMHGHDCYVSFLFAQLSDAEKSEIECNIDFFVDFDGLYCIYDI